MNLNLTLSADTLRKLNNPKKPTKSSRVTAGRSESISLAKPLPGSRNFKDISRDGPARHLTAPQTWDSARHVTISARPGESVHLDQGVNAKLTAFCERERELRAQLRAQLNFEIYRVSFISSLMSTFAFSEPFS